jgi:translation initiation factor eIF-2B subunit alpha
MVYVTQSSPTSSGERMYQRLKDEGIRCRLIPDTAIGFFLDKVDVVLVGAEAVAKNGGIINHIGTYPLAVCAKAVNKPFYVLVESYKFSKLYPLKQEDIPTHLQFRDNSLVDENTCSAVDYTPPHFVTLLITDLGPLATAAVSDVLMQLYT